LRPGDWVEVRSKDEILATLSSDASLDAMPFMPEMFQFCGKRFQVYKRADKTCDTVDKTGGLRVRNTVHLPELRCDGSGHGGCEAGCLMFWREAWLKRVGGEQVPPIKGAEPKAGQCTELDVARAAVADAGQQIYRCQITRLRAFTEALPWWDVRQYVRDVAINGVGIGKLVRTFLFVGYRELTELGVGYRALISLYDWFQSLRGGTPFPLRSGTCEKTPTAVLGLQPGEWVRVKPYPEILATLDPNNKNRGLWFDAEMVRYCGGTYRVVKRVRRILDERTGKMLEFSNPCIVLQDVFCRAETTENRLFCPRENLIYWREIWLERASMQDVPLNRLNRIDPPLTTRGQPR